MAKKRQSIQAGIRLLTLAAVRGSDKDVLFL